MASELELVIVSAADDTNIHIKEANEAAKALKALLLSSSAHSAEEHKDLKMRAKALTYRLEALNSTVTTVKNT